MGDSVDEAGLAVVKEEKEGMEMQSDGFPRLWPVCMSAESDRAGGLS
jgi:hypothetical protein